MEQFLKIHAALQFISVWSCTVRTLVCPPPSSDVLFHLSKRQQQQLEALCAVNGD